MFVQFLKLRTIDKFLVYIIENMKNNHKIYLIVQSELNDDWQAYSACYPY